MKKSFIVIRWIVGLLFIFSGLIKANDPLGLSYKMQEFFEVWGLQSLNDYTLAFALIMNVFEVIAGVAVIIGWRMRIFSWLLLLLIIFFCFLTGYAYLTGSVKTCGCFGDCIPLTPLESFIKDLVLLILIIILFINRNVIQPVMKLPAPQIILILYLLGVCFLQYYVLNYLPLKDCLPYKKGSNIIENMHVLSSAKPDSFALTFKYRKDGKNVEFDANDFPADFDSTYEFVERYQKLIRKGSDGPAIVDFALQNVHGEDTTIAILSQPNFYVMLMIKDFSTFNAWHNAKFKELLNELALKHLPFFIVTSDKDEAMRLLGNDPQINILVCDGIVIKTAARVNPTYFIMQLANIKDKYSYKQTDKVIDAIKSVPKNIYDSSNF